jgi:uncharacterized protein (TIGR02145 family)
MDFKILFTFLLFVKVTLSQESFGNLIDSRDGKNYKTIVIGSQIWMGENLNTVKFRNGDVIPEIKTEQEWENANIEGKPAWCYYRNDSKNGGKYGKLYNWHAVNDPRGLAPIGWHVPSDSDWSTLSENLGGVYFTNNAGVKMKAQEIMKVEITYVEKDGYYETKWVPCSNCSYWTDNQKENNPCLKCKNQRGQAIKTGKYIPKTKKKIENFINIGWNGTNESGFHALPGSKRDEGGDFGNCCGEFAYWWSSTEDSYSFGGKHYNHSAKIRFLKDDYSSLHANTINKGSGLSIRCIKD